MRPGDIILENDRALLTPLSLDHLPELLPIAAQPGLTRYSPSEIDSEAKLSAYIQKAMVLREAGSCLPFLIRDKANGIVAGTTRFMNMDRVNKLVHIGSTWIGREFQGTGLNTAVKILMIDFAFADLGAEKVEFRIDERNTRSRKAVEKLGALLEGVLRKDVYLPDGFKRNTCCYGLFTEEWQRARKGISHLIH